MAPGQAERARSSGLDLQHGRSGHGLSGESSLSSPPSPSPSPSPSPPRPASTQPNQLVAIPPSTTGRNSATLTINKLVTILVPSMTNTGPPKRCARWSASSERNNLEGRISGVGGGSVFSSGENFCPSRYFKGPGNGAFVFPAQERVHSLPAVSASARVTGCRPRRG